MQRSRAHREALGMELPQTGMTGFGGPAGGRDINATTAGPLPKGGACAGTHPCGKFMPQWSYPSPRSAEWEKYHRFADRTSPRWESRTRGSNETIAGSRDDWDHTRRHGLRGSAGSPLVRRQRWDEQRISKWVWPSSCRGPTEERLGGMPGDE